MKVLPAGLVLLMAFYVSQAQKKIAVLEVNLDRETNGLSIPVSYRLNELTKNSADKLSLTHNGTPVKFQVEETKDARMLHWMVDNNGKGTYTYELHTGTGSMPGGISINDQNEEYVFTAGGQELMTYHYGIQRMATPPARGEAINYERGGFIHPLKSPTGQVLTRIQAPDHYHHYGIWNPWTHTEINGEVVDFWNIGSGKTTVLVEGTRGQVSGPVFGEVKADLAQVMLHEDRSIKLRAIEETQTMRVYTPQGKESYLLDFTSDFGLGSETPVKILAYRYAGFGWRATAAWNAENSEMITSEGINVRSQINSSTARWCIVQGMTGSEYAGAVILSSPENHGHPEPMRVWDENDGNTLKETGKKGAVFFNFNPAMEKVRADWDLKAGKMQTLKYRMVVFTGKFTPEKAESAWQYFAKPAEVKVKKK